MVFDDDEPGRKGTDAALLALAKNFHVCAPEVPKDFKPHHADEQLFRELLFG